MARKPVSVFKRPMSKKGQYRYYVQIWDVQRQKYSIARSATAIAKELELDPKAYPPTSKTGALLIGEELRKRGGVQRRLDCVLFADYCDKIWEWENSHYIQDKLLRGQRIGREYVSHNAAYIKTYVRPAFPSIRLDAVRAYMIEDFAMKLKRDSGLGNRSINAILAALSIPLHEAARTGMIQNDPAVSIRKLGNDTKEKGIPTEEEVRAILSIDTIDLRVRTAILLAAACALRIGEIQALKKKDIGERTLTVGQSWGKMEGLKETKTGRVRLVPLPQSVRTIMLELAETNPHGSDGFLMFGAKEDAPLDVRALERGFYKALATIGIDEEARTDRGLSFHSLRHWANAMLRGSVPDSKLHMLTGHSTEAMTNHYDHATESDIAELARAQEEKILPVLVARIA